MNTYVKINSNRLSSFLTGLRYSPIAALIILTSHASYGQSAPVIYPSKGQSLEQQSQDEGACRVWAQQQTGFNPSQGPVKVTTNSGSGQVLRGAAGGAAVGAVGGAIGGSAGKGAAIGAGVGATLGLLKKGQQRRESEEAQRQANAQYNQQLSNYNRAFGTCMQGRGYTVN